MKASEFTTEDNFGTHPKRPARTGSRHPRGHEPVPRYKTMKDQDVAEGRIESDPWGDQGRFAGDTHIDLGGETIIKLRVGDRIKYFGVDPGEIVELSKDGKRARVHLDKGIVQTVNTNDLVRVNKGVAEGYNPEYDDEAGMADNNLETLERAVRGIDDLIQSGDNLPEWCQEKIAVAKSMLVAVWDYMESEEDSEEVDPEIDAMFEAMDQLAEEMAVKNGVDVDAVWETFEAMDDNVLYETAAWRRKEGKSKKGGLNAKGVASYRRENPGSKLQMAVTTKPSKLKPGSKAAKRRKSFCARMSGVKGPMKKPNGKPTRKALALRKWNC